MQSQQSYSNFPLNHGYMQENFGGYPQHSQPFYLPPTRSDHVNLGWQTQGDHSTQTKGWNPPAPLEPPSHLSHMNFYPPQHPVRDQIRYHLGAVTIKEEGDDKPVSAFPGVQYYHPYWNNSIWPGNANPYPVVNQEQEASNGATCTVLHYPPNQSPITAESPTASTMESPQCSSTSPNLEVPEGASANPAEVQGLISSGGEEAQECTSRAAMENFVRQVKERRVAIGFTQADVGCTLGVLCGKLFSQTTICRFESLQLSTNNMCQLQPLMKRWMAEKAATLEQMINKEQALTHSKRKRRTNIENIVKGSLEACFLRNPKPGTPEMAQIARDLHLDKNVVRVWFCNRRQKDRRHVQSGESSDMQPMVNPYMGPFPPPQEMSPQNYMPPPPHFYPHGFNHRNDAFPPHMPHGVPHGNHI